GYVWEADRWLKKGEKHPWDPNKKPETLPPPPQVDKGQGSIAQNSTPRILLKVEKCFIKSMEDGQVVILTGKTDFPNGTILVNEFSHYFEPDMALSRTEITINRKEYDKTFSAIIGPLAETIPKGLYLVTTKFNPFIQTNDVLAKTGRQTAKDTLTLIVGTKKDIENMINLTVPKLESIIAESEDLYKELGENYQSTTASKDTKTFSVWTKEFP
ncbi:MAG: hypothetical protein HY762_04380, partial [Planctomycetes bacterium]|nr:hypothetical protein [Planctomycetota bacterium]